MINNQNDSDYLIEYDLDEKTAKRFDWKHWKENLIKEYNNKFKESNNRDLER